MGIFYREKTFHAGKKIRKNDFAPSEKYACYAPAPDQTIMHCWDQRSYRGQPGSTTGQIASGLIVQILYRGCFFFLTRRMRARQYKVQQYNDARFSSITCCTRPIPGKVKLLLISGKKSPPLLDHISRFLSHKFVTWYLRSISKTKIVKLFCPCMSEHMIYIKNVTNVTQTLHQNVTNVTKQNIASK